MPSTQMCIFNLNSFERHSATLAYYNAELITAIKSFIIQWLYSQLLFSTNGPDKLERLSLCNILGKGLSLPEKDTYRVLPSRVDSWQTLQ
jgi:hypothetical protein